MVHILLAEGREENNWQKAQSNYHEVQSFIVRASDLEVYADAERLIPDDVEPRCVEMLMDIEEYVRPEARKDSPGGKMAPKKRKRDDDPLRNVPEAAAKGFVSVKELLFRNAGTGKRRKKVKETDYLHADEDDSDDREIEQGVFGGRRAASTSAVPDGQSQKGKKKLVCAATTATGKEGKKKKETAASIGKAKVKKKAVPEQPSLSQLEELESDDSEDKEIEQGLSGYHKPLAGFKSAKSVLQAQASRRQAATPKSDSGSEEEGEQPRARSPKNMFRSSSPETPLASMSSRRRSRSASRASTSPRISTPPFPSRSIAPTSGSPGTISLTSSPEPPSKPHAPQRQASLAISLSPSPTRSPDTLEWSPYRQQPPKGPPSDHKPADSSIAWLIEDDDDPDFKLAGSSSPVVAAVVSPTLAVVDDHGFMVDYSPPPSPLRDSMNIHRPVSLRRQTTKTDMLPPPLPARFALSSPSGSEDAPPSPFAVRAHGQRLARLRTARDVIEIDSSPDASFEVCIPGLQRLRKRTVSEALEVDSSPLKPSPPAKRRLVRGRPPSPSRSPSPTPRSPAPAPRTKKRKRRFADMAAAQRHNPWMDVEAGHSDDELSAGASSDAAPDVPDSDDVRFVVADARATQAASPSYDQAAVYRRSLLTQAPPGLAFARAPSRRGLAGFGPQRSVSEGAGAGRWREATPPVEEGPDEYAYGSFVVDDDEEIVFASSSQ